MKACHTVYRCHESGNDTHVVISRRQWGCVGDGLDKAQSHDRYMIQHNT